MRPLTSGRGLHAVIATPSPSLRERGDFDELRRLADAGSSDAVDILVELAEERGDLDELQRLAEAGNRDAADMLSELVDETDERTSQHGVTVVTARLSRLESATPNLPAIERTWIAEPTRNR